MGNITIKEQPLFIVKEYRATYTVGSKATVHITKEMLGFEDIPGYKFFGVQQFIPGVISEQVFCLLFNDSIGAKVYNYSTTEHKNVVLTLWITWIRDDAVEVQ